MIPFLVGFQGCTNKNMSTLYAHTRAIPMCLHVSIFNNFLTVHNFGLTKKIKVYQESPLYTHFCLHTQVHSGQKHKES